MPTKSTAQLDREIAEALASKWRPMITIGLTPAQRDAVGTYITEEIHHDDYPEAKLSGSTLILECTEDRARDILADAANSADAGDGVTPDRGSRKALENILTKLRTRQAR